MAAEVSGDGALTATCPFDTAMRRFAEVHRFWHRSMENYSDPDEYLPDLNAAIQASRNVTFAIQKAKSQVPDFDAWYEPWQTSLRADPVMRWMHDARTRLVHSGDLEARSTTRVRLISDYFDATDELVDEFYGPSISGPPGDSAPYEESDQARKRATTSRWRHFQRSPEEGLSRRVGRGDDS